MKDSMHDLRAEIEEIRKENFSLKDDSAFVLWFLKAYLTDKEDEALRSVMKGSKDANFDAILVDDNNKQIHVVQGKFRQQLGARAEKKNDVCGFAQLAGLPWMNKKAFESFEAGLQQLIQQRVEELVSKVRRKHYELKLYYVTTGTVSKYVCEEARRTARSAHRPADLAILDGRQVMLLFKDYLDGVAPAVPALYLPMVSPTYVDIKGQQIRQTDKKTGIRSWVFSMLAADVGELYQKVGVRLFARNIRGYLGPNPINDAIGKTIKSEPDRFWYYNNGITFVCNHAEPFLKGRVDYLKVDRAQIINGQQTTRTLAQSPSKRAAVLVKVIEIPRTKSDDDSYDEIISSIVRATNWQNAIKPSDLVSNDYTQAHIERELRKWKYQYLRKRQSKGEAKRMLGSSYPYQISKFEIAKAVAACELDPTKPFLGVEVLFEEYYRDIFSPRSVSFYLSRYWLMRLSKKPKNAPGTFRYAQWLVLKFAWDQLAKYIERGQGGQRFRYACEHQLGVLRDLRQATDGIYRAAYMFYRRKRGRGEKEKEPATFFKSLDRVKSFRSFWASRQNRYRTKVRNYLTKFRKSLEEVEVAT